MSKFPALDVAERARDAMARFRKSDPHGWRDVMAVRLYHELTKCDDLDTLGLTFGLYPRNVQTQVWVMLDNQTKRRIEVARMPQAQPRAKVVDKRNRWL